MSTRPSDMHFSILERLQDDDPGKTAEAPSTRHTDLSHYKGTVARDLEALLNTRCLCLDQLPQDQYPLAYASLLSFGIMDLSGLSIKNPQDQERLRESVEKTIQRHEPRLSEVRVALDMPKESPHVVRFKVEGKLETHPQRPPVSFDAMMQLSSNTYQVRT